MSKGKRINFMLRESTADALEALLEASYKNLTDIIIDAIEFGSEYTGCHEEYKICMVIGPAPRPNISHLNHMLLSYSKHIPDVKSGRDRINVFLPDNTLKMLKEATAITSHSITEYVSGAIDALRAMVIDTQAGNHVRYVHKSRNEGVEKLYLLPALQTI